MKEQPDILAMALPETSFPSDMKLIGEEDMQVGKGLSLHTQRYAFPQAWPIEDMGMVFYQKGKTPDKTSIQLSYCIVGNRYCSNPACKNSGCQLAAKKPRNHQDAVIEVISISFHPGLLQSFDTQQLAAIFNHKASRFVKTISPSTKSKLALEQMIHHSYEGVLKNIFLQSKGMELLLYSSDQFIKNDPEEKYGCRFLTHESDRQKITRAREILLERLDSPITIKELARMVAMNECYLKKGFKAMFGTTIYDYFQKERMERARFLLYEKGLPVSEVAILMGYSCISHFSTAFKKHTGLKPCELLR